ARCGEHLWRSCERSPAVIDIQSVDQCLRRFRKLITPAAHVQVQIAVTVHINEYASLVFRQPVLQENTFICRLKRSVGQLYEQRPCMSPRTANKNVIQPISIDVTYRHPRPLSANHMED